MQARGDNTAHDKVMKASIGSGHAGQQGTTEHRTRTLRPAGDHTAGVRAVDVGDMRG